MLGKVLLGTAMNAGSISSQYYIHWNIESPAWNSLDRTDLKHFNDFFNFTMSYRQDADFPAPYGSIEQVNQIFLIFEFKNNLI